MLLDNLSCFPPHPQKHRRLIFHPGGPPFVPKTSSEYFSSPWSVQWAIKTIYQHIPLALLSVSHHYFRKPTTSDSLRVDWFLQLQLPPSLHLRQEKLGLLPHMVISRHLRWVKMAARPHSSPSFTVREMLLLFAPTQLQFWKSTLVLSTSGAICMQHKTPYEAHRIIPLEIPTRFTGIHSDLKSQRLRYLLTKVGEDSSAWSMQLSNVGSLAWKGWWLEKKPISAALIEHTGQGNEKYPMNATKVR